MRLPLRAAFALAVVLLAAVGISNGAMVSYIASLSGPNESPPNASPGTGTVHVDIDVVAHTLHVNVTFSGLEGTTTACHIHSPTSTPGTGTAGVATMVPAFTGFPLGVTSGSLDATFDTSLTTFYNAPFLTANGGTAAGAEDALAASLAADTAYFNIHSTVVPGGEIRGFLIPVPEPASAALFLLAASLVRRRT